MSRRARRVLFYILVVVFAVSGTAAAFYSNGWRIDTETWAVRKTGAIFVRVQPREAEITVDGEATKGGSGFLLSGTLIKNLLPGEYEVTLTAAGFKNWSNILPVKEGVVTEIKDIALVPDEVPSIHTASTTAEIALTAGGPAITSSAGKLTYQGKTLAGSKFIGATADLNRVVTYNGRQDTYLWNDLREGLTVNLNLRFRAAKPAVNGRADTSGIRKMISDPSRTSMVIVVTNKAVYRYNVDNDEVEMISAASANNIVPYGSELILDRRGEVVAYNFDSGETRTLMTFEGEVEKIGVGEGGAAAALGENGALVYYTPAGVREAAHSVKDFSFGPGNQIAFLEKNGQLNIFYPAAGFSRRTNTLGNITSLEWIGTRHLALVKPEQVVLVELLDPSIGRDEPVLYAAPIINEPVKQLKVDVNRKIYFITETGSLEVIDYFDDLVK